jgi:hypothetical protein
MYMVWWEGGENSETQREGIAAQTIYDEPPQKAAGKKSIKFSGEAIS